MPRKKTARQQSGGNAPRVTKKLICQGSLISDLQIQKTILTTLHSHDPKPYTTAAKKMHSVIDEAASTSWGTPAQLLADNTAAESLEVLVSVGAHEKRGWFLSRVVLVRVDYVRGDFSPDGSCPDGFLPGCFCRYTLWIPPMYWIFSQSTGSTYS